MQSLYKNIFTVFLAKLCCPINTFGQVDLNDRETLSGFETDSIDSLNLTIVEPAETSASSGWLADYEIILTIAVLIFILIVLGIATYAFQRLSGSQDMVVSLYFRFISISVMIAAILIVVTAGHNHEILSPVLGLLGTIAGYLLGRGDSWDLTNKKTKP